MTSSSQGKHGVVIEQSCWETGGGVGGVPGERGGVADRQVCFDGKADTELRPLAA